jgi:hypothetical protein
MNTNEDCVLSSQDSQTSQTRRGLLGQAASVVLGGATVAALLRPNTALASSQMLQTTGWYNAKADFGATGNGSTDDTAALQTGINTASSAQCPLFVPPGSYRITQPLTIPSNTMLVGSNVGLGFGCVIAPVGCPAFNIGGSTQSFACAIENLTIYPTGSAPDHIISIDNSYSVYLRNIRIYDAQAGLGTGAVVLLGGTAAGGHGPCNNIIWDNLIVRNDTAQSNVAVFAANGCGTHRFITPDLENFGTLFEWQGGQIELVCPYTERAGVFCLDCNATTDSTAYLNTYGGVMSSAPSGTACGIQYQTQGFNSFGTNWSNPSGGAAYVYGMPVSPVTFHGLSNPNLTTSAGSNFNGSSNIAWQLALRFPELLLRNWVYWTVTVPSGSQAITSLTVTGVQVGYFWARASFDANLDGVVLVAYVQAANSVAIVAQNGTGTEVSLAGNVRVECGWW